MKNLQRTDKGNWVWRIGLDEIIYSYKAICDAPQLSKPFLKKSLFIKGENSDYIAVEHKELILEKFPAASVKVIQGAGHWLHAEKPQAFNRLVLNFLSA